MTIVNILNAVQFVKKNNYFSFTMISLNSIIAFPLNGTYFNYRKRPEKNMKFKVIVHEAEEGGYWAEVPSIPGCVTQ